MIAIIYNSSIKNLFYKYAELLKNEFDNINITSHIYSSQSIYEMNGIYNFNSAVYLDKDIILGNMLENANIRLFNPIESIRICDDKRLTFLKLHNKYPFPKTVFSPIFFTYDKKLINDFIKHVENSFNYPLIAKLAQGSLGKEVFLITKKSELISFIEMNYTKSMLFCEYLDEFPGKDVRVYVVGSKVIASMMRYNPNDFRSNIALSGKGFDYKISESTKEMCIGIANDLQLDFCGIDLLFKNGTPSVICEVNSNAMFEGINKACNAQIEKHITNYISNIFLKT